MNLVGLKADCWYRAIHKKLKPLTVTVTAASLLPSVGTKLTFATSHIARLRCISKMEKKQPYSSKVTAACLVTHIESEAA